MGCFHAGARGALDTKRFRYFALSHDNAAIHNGEDPAGALRHPGVTHPRAIRTCDHHGDDRSTPRHHGKVLWGDEDGRVAGLWRRIPLPLRIGLFGVWAAFAAFGKWESVNHHAAPRFVDIALLTGGVVLAAFGIEHFFRTCDRPHRPPFDPISQGWLMFFVVTGSLLGVGVLGLVDHDPTTPAGIAVGMLTVGVVLVLMFIRYLRKPVERKDPPQRSPYLPP